MALSDILERIGADSGVEADAIIDAAEQAAEEILAAARTRADAESAAARARGEKSAISQADTIRASARLAARDSALTARRELIVEALERAVEALAGLPDDRYTALFAHRIAAVARGGEAVHLAAADVSRLSGLSAAVEKASGRALALTYPGEPAAVEHGVVLRADRAMVDLSLQAIVAERRGEFEMLVSHALFDSDREV